MSASGPGGNERLDELRRRLYAPDATEADVVAYRAARSADDQAGDGAPPPPARRRSAARLGAIATATLVVVAGAVVLAVAHPPAPTPSRTAPAPAGRIAVPASVRNGFVRDLETGADPGLLAYLDAHPAALRTRVRTDRTESTGVGPTTLALAPPTTTERAGHVTVVLVTDRQVAYEWRATVIAASNDRSGPEPSVATHDGRAASGEPVSGTVGYEGGVPTALTLLLPTGVRWAAVVLTG